MESIQNMPKYKWIYEFYAQKIRNGELREDDRLPTEEEISQRFGVSRVTVRKALNELVYQGYLVKKHSKGSFVRTGRLDLSLSMLQGFTEEMSKRGLRVRSKLLRVALKSVGNDTAEKLELRELAKIYELKRLRLADDVPMAIETVRLPYFCCPDLEQYDLQGSLYSLLSGNYGLSPAQARQSIGAGLAEKREAVLLEISPGDPVLRIERITKLADGTPLEYVTSVYRGDKYQFRIELSK